MAHISLQPVNAAVSRFIVDANQIVGLAEYTNGQILVSVKAHNGQIFSEYVQNTYDEIAEIIQQTDVENYMALEIEMQ